jgi:RNA polymerase sigma factor (sigma-70 family)
MAVRVAIVEDDFELRTEMCQLIDQTSGMKCIGAFGSAEEAIAWLPLDTPDVILMDINLPAMSGIDCTRRLKQLRPRIAIIMLTVYEDAETLFDALQAGACGYLLKRTSAEKILASIEDARNGGAPMTRQIARQVVEFFHKKETAKSELDSLTPREKEVLQLLAKGLVYKEVAKQLEISIDTVRSHLRNIYEKLQVNSRTEAVVKLLRQ